MKNCEKEIMNILKKYVLIRIFFKVKSVSNSNSCNTEVNKYTKLQKNRLSVLKSDCLFMVLVIYTKIS